MKANELMIGDWVYNKNTDKPMQIYPTIFSQMFRNNPNLTTEDYNIFSIPLTAEILEKNGFIKENECWVLSGKHTGDKIIFLFKVANGFAMPTSGMTIGFQEVHKLQHLLELCGIDKTIEL